MVNLNKRHKIILLLLLVLSSLIYYAYYSPHTQPEKSDSSDTSLSEFVIEGWQGPEVRKIIQPIPNAINATKYTWYQERNMSVSDNETAIYRFPNTIELIVTNLPGNEVVNFSELIIIESPDKNYSEAAHINYNATKVSVFKVLQVDNTYPDNPRDKVHLKAYFQIGETVVEIGYFYSQRELAKELGECIITGKCIV